MKTQDWKDCGVSSVFGVAAGVVLASGISAFAALSEINLFVSTCVVGAGVIGAGFLRSAHEEYVSRERPVTFVASLLVAGLLTFNSTAQIFGISQLDKASSDDKTVEITRADIAPKPAIA
jgi:hypothetical protein